MTTKMRITMAGAVLAAGIAAHPAALPAQEHGHAQTGMQIPGSMRAEHAEIHAALESATRAPGQTGAAARELARVLHPHFVREEQIALPPLALLRPLAEGKVEPWMRAAFAMSDSLRDELPRMLQEHVAIGAAARHLEEVARAEGNTAVQHLAQRLQLHARQEEELFYPAAVLAGDLVRARTRPE